MPGTLQLTIDGQSVPVQWGGDNAPTEQDIEDIGTAWRQQHAPKVKTNPVAATAGMAVPGLGGLIGAATQLSKNIPPPGPQFGVAGVPTVNTYKDNLLGGKASATQSGTEAGPQFGVAGSPTVNTQEQTRNHLNDVVTNAESRFSKDPTSPYIAQNGKIGPGSVGIQSSVPDMTLQEWNAHTPQEKRAINQEWRQDAFKTWGAHNLPGKSPQEVADVFGKMSGESADLAKKAWDSTVAPALNFFFPASLPGSRSVATDEQGNPGGLGTATKQFAHPILGMAVGAIDPTQYLAMGSQFAADPGKAWDGLKNSFAQVVAGKTVEEKFAGALMWAGVLLPALHKAPELVSFLKGKGVDVPAWNASARDILENAPKTPETAQALAKLDAIDAATEKTPVAVAPKSAVKPAVSDVGAPVDQSAVPVQKSVVKKAVEPTQTEVSQVPTEQKVAPKPVSAEPPARSQMVHRGYNADTGPTTQPETAAMFGKATYFSDSEGYARNWASDPEIGRGYKNPAVESRDISGLRMLDLRKSVPDDVVAEIATRANTPAERVRRMLENKPIEDVVRDLGLQAKKNLWASEQTVADIAKATGYDGISYRGADGIGEHAVFKPVASPPDVPTTPEPKPIATSEAVKPTTEGSPQPKETPPVEPSGVSRSARSMMADTLGTEQPTTIHGDSHETLYENGKKAIADGKVDPDALVKDLAEKGHPASDAQVGILAAHRDGLIADLKKINGTLDREGLTDADRVQANASKQAILDHIQQFDQHIDEVKAANGRSLSAYRIGQTVDWGDLEQVEIEARRVKPTLTELPKPVKSAVEEIAKRDSLIADLEKEQETFKNQPPQRVPDETQTARISELEAENAKLKTEGQKQAVKPSKQRLTREAVQKEIDDLFDQFKKAKGSEGVGSSKRRGAVSITAEDIKAAGERATIAAKIVKAHVKLYAGVPLEEFITNVQKVFREKLGTEIDRQAVIDAAALKGPSKTKTEIQTQIEALNTEIRKNTSAALEKTRTAEEAKAHAASQKQLEIARKDAEKAAKEATDKMVRAKANAKVVEARRAEQAAQEALSKKAIEDRKTAANQLRAAKARERELTRRAQDAARAEQEVTNATEKARAKENTRQAKEQQRLAKLETDAKQKQAEKEFGDQWKYQEQVFKAESDIADLKQQLSEGRYRIPSKREVQVSEELENLRAEKQIYTNNIKAHLESSSQSLASKVMRGAASVIRGSTLGTDLGQLTRQGLFAWSRPKAALKGVAAGAKALLSDVNLQKIETAIQEKKIGGKYVAPIRREAGLSLTNSLTHPEELAIGHILARIPIIGKLAGKPLERAQLAFINTARAEVFDAGVEAGFSKQELATRARFINASTGRGSFKNVPALMETLMTSPRYEASRWQTMWEAVRSPYELGKGLVKGEGINRGALANIQDMAVTAGAAYGVFKMAEMAGYTVNWDPSSSDFLKMRKGDEVWDISAGLAPRLRDLFRLFTAVVNPEYRSTVKDLLGSSVTRTISPSVRIPVEQGSFAYQHLNGVEDAKSPFSGMAAGPGDEGIVTFTPLIFQSTKQAYDAEGPTAGFGAFLKELVGSGYNRYPEKK